MAPKRCRKCQHVQPVEQFQKQARTNDGYATHCKSCTNEMKRMYRERDKHRYLARGKLMREKNKASLHRKYNEYCKAKCRVDPQFRMKLRLRTNLCNAFTNAKLKKTTKTFKLLGCTLEEFMQHIVTTIPDGYTINDKLHLDHIIPCSYFDLANEWHQRVCFHWTNIQLLTPEENRKKSNTLPASKKIVDKLIKIRIAEFKSESQQS
jgi:hypothetical protein